MTEHQYDTILKALIVLLQTQEMTQFGMTYQPDDADDMVKELQRERKESAARFEAGVW